MHQTTAISLASHPTVSWELPSTKEYSSRCFRGASTHAQVWATTTRRATNSLEGDIERSRTPRRILSPRPGLAGVQKKTDVCEHCHGFGKPYQAFSTGERGRRGEGCVCLSLSPERKHHCRHCKGCRCGVGENGSIYPTRIPGQALFIASIKKACNAPQAQTWSDRAASPLLPPPTRADFPYQTVTNTVSPYV